MKVSHIWPGFRSPRLTRRALLVLSSCAGLIAGVARGGDVLPSFDKQNSRFVVFIHTGGGDAAVGDKLSAVLTGYGLVVARPDNYIDTVGGPGVDYFSPDDVAMAGFVAEQANQLLPKGSAALRPRFQSAVHNPSGFLGVWLYKR